MAEIKEHYIQKEYARQILQTAFQAALLSYLLYYLIESFSSGFISRFYYLGDHLWVVIALGLGTIIFPPEQASSYRTETVGTRQVAIVIAVGLIAGFILFLRINTLGWLALVLAPLASLIIICLALFILHDREDQG